MARAARAREQQAIRRLFTPRLPFSVHENGRDIVLNPGELVDDGDPIYRNHPDKFREPRVRQYA